MSGDPKPGADVGLAEAEALVRDYLDLWNAGDLEPIWASYYAPDARLPWDRAGMQAAKERLAAMGFSHSELQDLTAELPEPGKAQIVIRFRRVAQDGATLPPGVVRSIYHVWRLPDLGWRIVEMGSLGVVEPLE